MNKPVTPTKPALIKPSDVVYVSGPMTGIKNMNGPAFREAHQFLENHFGCTIINPVRHPQKLPYDYYMKLAAVDVEQCTVCVFLPGWEKSNGAKQEWDWAHDHGKMCYFLSDLEDEVNKLGKVR